MKDSHHQNRNAVIDLLRFIFAVMIVLYHSKSFAGHSLRVITGGYIAVDFFFLLSGYYLAYAASSAPMPYDEKNKINNIGKDTFLYIYKRMKRLYPEFIIASLIALIARSLVLHWNLKVAAVKVAKAAGEWTFLQMAGFETGSLVGATWFLSAMILASALLYPLARRFQNGFYYYGAPMIFIFLFGLTYRTIPHFQNHTVLILDIVYVGLVRAIMELSGGCFIYILAEEMKKIHWKPVMRYIFTILEVLAFGFVIIYYSRGRHFNKIDW